MATLKGFKRQIDDLKQDIKRAVADARAKSSAAEVGTRNLNVAGRANTVVAKNVGTEGSSHSASASQRVCIRQNGEETYEENATIDITSRGGKEEKHERGDA